MTQPFRPQDIYPAPQEQNQPEKPATGPVPASSASSTPPGPSYPSSPATKSSSVGLIFGLGGGLVGLLMVVGIIMWLSKTELQTYTNTGTANLKNQAQDIRIKSDLSQIKTDLQLHFEVKQSYEDYTPSVSLKNDLTNAGSELKIANLSDKTYVIYAPLLTSDFYCLDSTGFLGKVTAVPQGSTCQ